MNVRLFMLIAMTALFGELWSSDRQYQETQVAQARAARQAAARPMMASVETPAAPVNVESIRSIAVNPVPEKPLPISSVLISSTIANSPNIDSLPPNDLPRSTAPSMALPETISPLIAEPSPAAHAGSAGPESVRLEPVRQPVVAHRVVASGSLQTVTFLLNYRRPIFTFEVSRNTEVSGGAIANAERSPEAGLARLFRWVDRLRSELAGETCWMRWQFRRSAYMTQRRVTALLRQRSDWTAVAEQVGRGALGQIDSMPTDSAARTTDEKR